MSNNVWKTLFTADFSNSNYLYHYTNVDKAIKILSSNSLKFSKINATNDTSESKPKILFEQPTYASKLERQEFDKKTEKIMGFFYQKSPLIRLLCFSMDMRYTNTDIDRIIKTSNLSDKDRYYNILGRGFALPRMWAQYASNNEGVCFIIDKAKLLSQISQMVEYYKDGPVKYKKFFANYLVDKNSIDSLYNKISSETNNNLTMARMFSNDSDFVKFCFFEKLFDWKCENEYRIVALTDTENDLYIDNFQSFLKGVVLGEKIEPAYEKILHLLLDGKCEIRKISFDNNICRLI